MLDTLGIILSAFGEENLGELTLTRAVAAMPVCGRYRLIDFVLSNMVNSGVRNIGIPARTSYLSLTDHLGSGKEWDLNRKRYGLRILPPDIACDCGSAVGSLDLFNGVLKYLKHADQKYVLIAAGDIMFNTAFGEMKAFHIENGADVTVMYSKNIAPPDKSSRPLWLAADEDGLVTDMKIGGGGIGFTNMQSMGIYFMEKSFLEYHINRCISRGLHDFIMDVLVRGLDKTRIYAFPFGGYVGKVDSVASYFRENMRLLEPEICRELFDGKNQIYTKVKNQVPTIFGEHAEVKNSLIADGCVIDGKVENSVVFRGVRIAYGSAVSNSIVMQNSSIASGARLDYAILDKNVLIKQGRRLAGQESYPVVIAKNSVV